MFSTEELTIIETALMRHSCRLLADVEAYRDQGNKEAQKDALSEWRKVNKLYDKVFAYIQDRKVESSK